jgi:hypothetical protein
MENSIKESKLSFKDVNSMDIVEYLASQGIYPVRPERNGKCWYSSPIRDGDSTPSFIVWKRTNTWHDFGTGKGRTLVDLGMELHHCTALEFLLKMSGPSEPVIQKAKLSKAEAEAKVQILDVGSLTDYRLISYIKSRKIPMDVAKEFAVQVKFKIYAEQIAVGFRNDKGGYELRNAFGKISSLPKDSTFINNGSSALDVTEGQFDFYTRVTILKLKQEKLPNFLILNGTGFFDQKIPLMQEHAIVRLFLDQGLGARRFTANALSIDKHKFSDESSIYRHHDDLNEWWQLEGYKIFRGQPPSESADRPQSVHR